MALLLESDALTPGRLLAQSWALPARAASTAPDALPAAPFWTNRGRWTFGTQVGLAFEIAVPQNISHIRLLIAQPQIGFIVRDFESHRFPVRRFEVLSEGILGGAVHPKARLTGYGLLFRLEGKSGGPVVPFLDFGAGVQSTTLNTRAPELSGTLQFSPQGGPGIEWFLSPQRALVFQYRYMHMSNAGIELPNNGFNAGMVSIGFRWLRRPRPPGWREQRHSRNPFHHND